VSLLAGVFASVFFPLAASADRDLAPADRREIMSPIVSSKVGPEGPTGSPTQIEIDTMFAQLQSDERASQILANRRPSIVEVGYRYVEGGESPIGIIAILQG
jgi:hypothetical protein